MTPRPRALPVAVVVKTSPCPRCGAVRGLPCLLPTGKQSPSPHVARRADAVERLRVRQEYRDMQRRNATTGRIKP